MSKTACDQCPWRASNQGKRNSFGFYTKANLTRLWNGLRNGNSQSCHMTDPSHQDHIAAGAKPGSTARECPGSIILITREIEAIAGEKKCIDNEAIDRYRETRRKGLTANGILYWIVQRIQMAGVPFIGGEKLPDVKDDPEV
jgi:hypothetical protein